MIATSATLRNFWKKTLLLASITKESSHEMSKNHLYCQKNVTAMHVLWKPTIIALASQSLQYKALYKA